MITILQHVLLYCVWKKSCTSSLYACLLIVGVPASIPTPPHCNIAYERTTSNASGKGKNPAPPMSPHALTSGARPILQWWGLGEYSMWLTSEGMLRRVARWCRISSTHRQLKPIFDTLSRQARIYLEHATCNAGVFANREI